MIVAKLPFAIYLKYLRQIGREKGFAYLVALVSREADSPQVFEEVESSWSSIHDLTGNAILFMTIDGSEHSVHDPKNGRISGNYGLQLSTVGCRLNGRMHSPKIRDKDVRRWFVSREAQSYSVSPRRPRRWRDNQSIGISHLIAELDSVDERDVPCLYFECLQSSTDTFRVPLSMLQSSGVGVYELLKQLLSDPENPINEIVSLSERHIRGLEARARSAVPKAARRATASRQWLCQWQSRQAELDGEVAEFIQSALDGARVAKDVYKSIAPLKEKIELSEFAVLRSHLNRIVDRPWSTEDAEQASEQEHLTATVKDLRRRRSKETFTELALLSQIRVFELLEARGRPSDKPNKRFRVALSYASEQRSYVEQVAAKLALLIGKKRVFFDLFTRLSLRDRMRICTCRRSMVNRRKRSPCLYVLATTTKSGAGLNGELFEI